METNLLHPLHPCLSMSKLIFFVSLPLSYIRHTSSFDDLMRDSLSDLAVGLLSDWAWKKSSFLSSLGGINIQSTNRHSPIAYMSSLAQSNNLICRILGHQPAQLKYLVDILPDLAKAVGMPDSLTDIDVPLQQCALSQKIVWLPTTLSLPLP